MACTFIKCIKPHNAYHGCERCTDVGQWQGRVIFNQDDSFLRRDEQFAKVNYKDHQVSKSLLIDFNLPCVLDYMHLVCLGDVHRLLLFWKEGPNICLLSHVQIKCILERLNDLAGKIPSDFVRQPRSLLEFKRWKATEFRLFLMHTGPYVLKNVLKQDLYIHFLCLCIAIRVLDDNNSSSDAIGYASMLLKWFVPRLLNIMVQCSHHTMYIT